MQAAIEGPFDFIWLYCTNDNPCQAEQPLGVTELEWEATASASPTLSSTPDCFEFGEIKPVANTYYSLKQ